MSEQDEQVAETIIPDEELNLELEPADDVETLRSQIIEKDTFARQAVARAKKAEAELKTLKSAVRPAEANTNKNALSPESVEIKILKAQGKSEDDINYLKKIAAVNGTGVIDAQKDDLYVAYQTKKDSDAKAEKAKLGASRGSGSVRQEKTVSSPGLTDAEHKALWKEQNGR